MPRLEWLLYGRPDEHESYESLKHLAVRNRNSQIILDDAAREYEYMHRSLESLDTKGAVSLGASLALLTFAGASDGRVFARLLVIVLALVAGMLSAFVLAPGKVRIVETAYVARQYRDLQPDRLKSQLALQYLDATEFGKRWARTKSLRLRASLVVLFVSAVCIALI